MRSIAVEGLDDEQVERVQRYAELLRRVGPREVAGERIHRLLDDLRKQPDDLTEEEAMDLALEAQAWARQQRR